MTTQPSGEVPGKLLPAGRWRFSLGTFFLVTALGLAILANFLQYRAHIAREQAMYETYRDQMQDYLYLLQNNDEFDHFPEDKPEHVHVSMLPSNSSKQWYWQISMPDLERYSLRFSAEGISADGIPQGFVMDYQIEGATNLKVSLNSQGETLIPIEKSVLIACESLSNSRNVGYPWHRPPSNHYVALPPQLHLWHVAGNGYRASFPKKGPIVLLRLREKPPLDANASSSNEADEPGRGFMVWIEKTKP